VRAALHSIDAEGDRGCDNELEDEMIGHEMRAEIANDCAGDSSQTAVHTSGERTGNVRQNDRDRGNRRPVGLVEMKHHRGEHG
jgi:hypothetical protein